MLDSVREEAERPPCRRMLIDRNSIRHFHVGRVLDASSNGPQFRWSGCASSACRCRRGLYARQDIKIRFLMLNVLSGSDPSFILITSMWYTRRQQPVRLGLWYTANGFGIALGGLLGFGIGHISGALASWRYEFLIIGALCCIWGVVMCDFNTHRTQRGEADFQRFIFLPDSPVTAKGLSLKEKRIAVERLRENQTGVENKVCRKARDHENAV